MRRLFPFCFLGLACGGSAGDPSSLVAGDYQFYTVAMEDGCLDGALETLFMPEGPENEHAFEYKIYLPHYDELPTSYAIDLRDPFVGMDVSLYSDDDVTLQLRGAVMESVLLGTAYGDCTVDMQVDADLLPISKGRIEGVAWLNIQNPQGSEDLCPVFASDDCLVTLSLRAAK